MGTGITEFPVYLLINDESIHKATPIPDLVQLVGTPGYYKLDTKSGKWILLLFSTLQRAFGYCKENKLPSNKVLATEMNRFDLIAALRKMAAQYPCAILDKGSPDESPILETHLLLAQLERDEQEQFPRRT